MPKKKKSSKARKLNMGEHAFKVREMGLEVRARKVFFRFLLIIVPLVIAAYVIARNMK
jgi:hypothetical protein